MNCKAPYQGLLHDLCLCFDIVFAQLVVIPRRRSKFIEIVAVVVIYLSIYIYMYIYIYNIYIYIIYIYIYIYVYIYVYIYIDRYIDM